MLRLTLCGQIFIVQIYPNVSLYNHLLHYSLLLPQAIKYVVFCFFESSVTPWMLMGKKEN